MILKPLLYRHIAADFLVGKKGPADDGICPVRPHKGPAFQLFFLPAPAVMDPKAPLDALNLGASAVQLHRRAFWNLLNHPLVEFGPVQIQIKPLIPAGQPGGQVDGAHRENLRLRQQRFGQRQPQAGQGFLGVWRQQAAAGLFKASGGPFLVDSRHLIFPGQQPGQRRPGRA